MERDYAKELASFSEVWKRVEKGQGTAGAAIKLMPRKEAKSAAVRFTNPARRKA